MTFDRDIMTKLAARKDREVPFPKTIDCDFFGDEREVISPSREIVRPKIEYVYRDLKQNVDYLFLQQD
jgi:hypothetical protein